MKIGFFEIYRHPECLNSFCKIFSGIINLEKISVFTVERFAAEFKQDYPEINWYVKSSESTYDYLQTHADKINELDLLIIGTMVIYEDLNVYLDFDFKPVLVFRIHNFNFWFNRFKSFNLSGFFPNIKVYLKILLRHLVYRGNLFKINRFLAKVDYFMFYNDVMQEYATQNFPILKKKTISHFIFASPYLKFNEIIEPAQNVISIPGFIDEKRRDYQLIYNVLLEIKPKLKEKLIVKFLGKPINSSGFLISNKIRSLSNDNLEIITFNKRLTQTEMLEEIKDSKILLSPIRINTYHNLHKEIYGETKVSGIEDDIIKYLKPAILPTSYKASKHIQPFIYKYSNKADLCSLLLKIVNENMGILSSKEIYMNLSSDEFFSDYSKLNILRSIIPLNKKD